VILTYQIPKADHPWRQYPNKARENPEEKNEVKSLRKFLMEVALSWDKVEITTSSYVGMGRYHLSELSDRKVAAWLMGILRRNYA